MFAAALGFLLKVLSGPAVDRALAFLERRADSALEQDKLRTQITIEQIRAAVASEQVMADFNKAKLQFPWFWVLVSIFVVPLSAWWSLVLADCIFYFPFDIANLPTPELRSMAKDMVSWLFYVGSGVGALKLVTR